MGNRTPCPQAPFFDPQKASCLHGVCSPSGFWRDSLYGKCSVGWVTGTPFCDRKLGSLHGTGFRENQPLTEPRMPYTPLKRPLRGINCLKLTSTTILLVAPIFLGVFNHLDGPIFFPTGDSPFRANHAPCLLGARRTCGDRRLGDDDRPVPKDRA